MGKRPTFFETVNYDFHVGEGADFLPTGDSTPDERENRLYQRKIDVVGFVATLVYLVEVKPVADVEALGQVLTYLNLMRKNSKVGTNIKGMVVTGRIGNDMQDVFQEHGVVVMVV